MIHHPITFVNGIEDAETVRSVEGPDLIEVSETEHVYEVRLTHNRGNVTILRGETFDPTAEDIDDPDLGLVSQNDFHLDVATVNRNSIVNYLSPPNRCFIGLSVYESQNP